MNNFPFTMLDICTLEGISIPPDGRAEYETVCPMCGIQITQYSRNPL